MTVSKALSVKQLYSFCDVSQFGFNTTAELDELSEIIGQGRALEAIHFGLGIKKHGYNLFALGPAGSGKQGVVRQLLRQRAVAEPASVEWCYINNFAQPHKPFMLALPPGRCAQLSRDMDQLVEELCAVIPAAFEGDEYHRRIQGLDDELFNRQEQGVEKVRQLAIAKQLVLIPTPNGFTFAAMRGDVVMSPKEFKQLPDDERVLLETEIGLLQDELQRVFNQLPQWQREVREQVKTLNCAVTLAAVGGMVERLKADYVDHARVQEYLGAVQENIVLTVDEFRRLDAGEVSVPSDLFKRYRVNLLVGCNGGDCVSVVFEDNPTYQNLVGRVEHTTVMGTLMTDFTLIKAGALHRANGGYLVLDANKLLQNPLSWDVLKRALQSRAIHIATFEQIQGVASTVSLEPEPIPLSVKVVLLGDHSLYDLLHQSDPEFKELFKVAADFDDQMARSSESNLLYARLIATLVKKEGLMAFDTGAVARVIEQGARISGDAKQLTTHMRSICDLLCESDYYAQQQGSGLVRCGDVQMAIDAQIRRSSRIHTQVHESIQRGLLLIQTRGTEVGQVNGLSVIELGALGFGMPTRITAQVRVGDGDVLDIEREVDLGGPVHSKGVMILAGYLGSRYARNCPLALSASLAFEQSYGEIEGDSASATELYALLSALSGVPIKQGIAVTGSVNQRGQVQAIGGVNEKIEGYFDVCKLQGLTGEQGVLIPHSNVDDLMLRQDVVEAVAAGMFTVYAVTTIDEGIEILTGCVAGVEDAQGIFPENSVNGSVALQLLQFAELRHEFGEEKRAAADEEDDKHGNDSSIDLQANRNVPPGQHVICE